ncbi:MAG: hypothetical protein WCQ99_03915 [Pseudomonadota bacterium]
MSSSTLRNRVIAEVAKHYLLGGCRSGLFFWHSRAQSEVEMVVKTEDSLRAFEVNNHPHGGKIISQRGQQRPLFVSNG